MSDLVVLGLGLAVSLLCSLTLLLLLLRARRLFRLQSQLLEATERARAAWRDKCMAAEARAHGVGGQAGARPTIKRVQA